MKVYLNKDSMYPVYFVSEKEGYGGIELEVPPELITEYHSVMVLFDEMQRKLQEYLG